MIARMRSSMLRPPGVLKAADGTPVPIFGAGGADVVGDALLYDAKKNPCGYDAREIARIPASQAPPGSRGAGPRGRKSIATQRHGPDALSRL